MNLRSGKAIAVVPLTPRTPNCIKGQNRALRAPLQKQFGNILKTAHSTKKTSQKNPEKPASSVTFDPDLSGECPNQSDLFTTTPRATRLTGRHRHSTELNREFEYAPGATKLNIWVQFGDECQRLVTRGNAKAKRARALFPISPSVSRDLETSWGLEDDSDPMEVTFSINFSVDASCHCIESEDFNQHKLIKDLQSSIKMTLQKSILPLKTRSVPNHSLVLGLDETLVHCQLTAMENVEFVFPVQFQDKSYQVYVRLRPYCKEFLENLSQFYEIILFTTATKDYADKLVDILDPQRRMIRHRLYRKDCICVQGNYIRELMVLGRDLAKTVVVDSSAETFACQQETPQQLPAIRNIKHGKCGKKVKIANGIQIKSWLKDPKDQELRRLIPFLQNLAHLDDVRPTIWRSNRLDSM
ncbi:CTD small phosphatase-like protein 2 isoform X3 [Scyliorhinus canicula]|uniref:CTD small phosphatase-like protein 2 isoform X3 n=1 Tax=Scyliorhinus canicula TaxID=7830 RepID=UPI0018F36107|nr:CTD small phosphatase-like protein 2 isoform X3 [Scyliorhinus canicula]